MIKSIENIIKHKDLLNLLATTKPRYNKKSIFDKADKQLIKAICEGALNLLYGNLPISESDKEKLKSFKNLLRKLTQKSSLANKKKLLNQKGGFLNILLPAIVTGISSIINNLIDKQYE
jgi:hypothetical protein